jgi:pantoate--beta-alanine ligase
METFKTTTALRNSLQTAREEKRSVAFVPTMGALHDGHRSCIEIARTKGDVLVVSIFVNPTQFGPTEDLDAYPVTPEKDLKRCREWGCDAVFLPEVSEIYPSEQHVWIDVGRIAEPMCGATRPGHFRGVATVVAKLFQIVGPDIAVFGQKDAQQALVIREMVEQLNMPVRLVLSPVVREDDGLALSSRNRYLSAADRARASGLYEALSEGRASLEKGERDPAVVCDRVRRRLAERGIADVEYVEHLTAQDLTSISPVRGRVVLASAVRVGTTRLIDNIVLEVGASGVEEAPLF